MLEMTFKNLTLTTVRHGRSVSGPIGPQRVRSGVREWYELNLSTKWIVRDLPWIQNMYYRSVISTTGQAPDGTFIGGRDP